MFLAEFTQKCCVTVLLHDGGSASSNDSYEHHLQRLLLHRESRLKTPSRFNVLLRVEKNESFFASNLYFVFFGASISNHIDIASWFLRVYLL